MGQVSGKTSPTIKKAHAKHYTRLLTGRRKRIMFYRVLFTLNIYDNIYFQVLRVLAFFPARLYFTSMDSPIIIFLASFEK